MTLPTFIGIGAQRAATTWLYNCLAAHPEVFMAEPKELHFFYRDYGLGLGYYEGKFADGARFRARGEITPDYMYHVEALERISRDVPGVKLFTVLRNPVDRAYSAYELQSARFRGMTFGEACDADESLIVKGRYFEHLSRAFEIFGRDRLAVYLYDDLRRDPAAFLRTLYAYVGVDAEFLPDSVGKTFNRMMYPRLQQLLIRSGLGFTIEAVKANPVGDWLRRRHAQNRDSAMSSQDRERLRHEYREDVVSLGELLGRDLTGWISDA